MYTIDLKGVGQHGHVYNRGIRFWGVAWFTWHHQVSHSLEQGRRTHPHYPDSCIGNIWNYNTLRRHSLLRQNKGSRTESSVAPDNLTRLCKHLDRYCLALTQPGFLLHLGCLYRLVYPWHMCSDLGCFHCKRKGQKDMHLFHRT